MQRSGYLLTARAAGCTQAVSGEREQDTELRMVETELLRVLQKMLLLCRPFLGRGSRVIDIWRVQRRSHHSRDLQYMLRQNDMFARLSMAIREEWKPAEISANSGVPGSVWDTEFFAHSGELLGKSNKATKSGIQKRVARKALLDAVDHRCVSVYGTSYESCQNCRKIAAGCS